MLTWPGDTLLCRKHPAARKEAAGRETRDPIATT
jgi:hypothetical protein